MKRLTSFAALLALSACVATEPYTAPKAELPPTLAKAATAAPAPAKWWAAFHDPALDRLVETALAQNLDVKQAVERITEARAGAEAAGAGLLPRAGGSAFAGRGDPRGTGASDLDTGTLEAGWTIDLFGKAAATRRAALAQVQAAEAGADSARLLVSGAVATAYADLRFARERLALTRASLTSRRSTRDLIQSTFDNGAATKLDTLQAEQLVLQAEAELPSLEIAEAQALNRLATLTGQDAGAVAALVGKGGQPSPRVKASSGVPAEVLRRRPDIRAAERRLAAASALVGVSKAELMPSLSIGGTITATSLGGAAQPSTWSFGPQLSLPIFAGGALRANVSAAESRARQAHLAWQAAVSGAVEEIANALASLSRDGRSVSAASRLVTISQETLELARSTLELGEGDVLAVLAAERTLLDARAGLAAAHRARAQSFIRLSVATAEGLGAP